MARLTSKKLYRQFRQSPLPADPRSPTPPGLRVNRRYLGQYVRWLRPHWRGLIVVFVLAMIGVGLATIKPIFGQLIIDQGVLAQDASVEQRLTRISVFGWAMVVVTLAASANGALRHYRETVLNAKLVFRLRQKLFDHLLRMGLSELHALKSGGIVSRLSGDVDSTTGLVQAALINPAIAVTQTIVAMGIVYAWNWRLALAITLILPPLVLLQAVHVRRIRPIHRSMRNDRGVVDGRVTETFSGIRVVRAFRRENKEERDYAVGHHTVIRKDVLADLIRLALRSGWGLVMPGISIVIVWYGGYLVLQDRASIGQLFAFQWYVFLVIQPVMMIIDSLTATQRGLASMERVFDVFEQPVDKPDAPHAIAAPPEVEGLRFEHVSFEYQPGLPVIRDFTLTVPGGKVVALVGPSGAGKSTLADLVARFQDPTSGSIRLNGIDLRDFKLASYRRLLAVVQQDVFLFDGTVGDNIAYGRPDATREQIEAAARRANAHDFIAALPEGYDTLIGERGLKLSGGQRQRLSIARAILADPRILILDEATSSLDTESEQLIQAALEDLYHNRTTFVIAHRLSTVTGADLIVVLDRGVMVESGTHEELMDRGGMYAQMVQRQRQALGDLAAARWGQ